MASSLNPASLFARDDDSCLACGPETPSCPTCPSGQVCSLIPQSCKSCAQMVCVSASVTGAAPPPAPNVAAIAGGVVGGVAAIAIATLLIWWFWIRPRREMEDEWEQEEWEQEQEEIKSQFREQRSRASVHTVRSVASTVMSRASNMIPIAFIPGVMNASGNAPPVPPIPAARSYSESAYSKSRGDSNAIFFSPGDLRNSAYSHVSDLADNRETFVGRPSITPSLARSVNSVNSEVYLDDAAENPMPAQQAVVSRPHMVSVKSTPLIGSPDSSVVASGPRVAMPSSGGPSAVNRSISFTKPQLVNLRSKPKSQRFPVLSTNTSVVSKSSMRSPLGDTDTEDDDDEDPHARARRSLLRQHHGVSDSAASSPTTASLLRSPFADDNASQVSVAASSSRYTPTTNANTLSAVIEEATRRASELPGRAANRDTSPFGDEHAVRKGD